MTFAPFAERPACPKCGGAEVALEYCRAEHADDIGLRVQTTIGGRTADEHLDVTCRRCGFGCLMACRDAGAGWDLQAPHKPAGGAGGPWPPQGSFSLPPLPAGACGELILIAIERPSFATQCQRPKGHDGNCSPAPPPTQIPGIAE